MRKSNVDHLKSFALSGCLQLILSIAVGLTAAYYLTNTLHIGWILGIGSLFYFLCYRLIVIYNKRLLLTSGIFSFFMTVAFILGGHIDLTTWLYLPFSFADVMYFLTFGLLFFLLVANIFAFFEKSKLSDWIYPQTVLKISPFKLGLIVFVLILLAWLPYYLYYFPGSMSVDSRYVIYQALGKSPLNDWHPVIYTACVSALVNLGLFLTGGNMLAAVAFFTAGQMLFLAAAIAYCISWLYQKHVRSSCLIVVSLYFALSPVFAVSSFTVWKDIPFGVLILLYSLYFYDIVESKGQKLFTVSGSLKYIVLTVITSLMRHNGYYAIVLTSLVFLIVFRKKVRKALPAILGAIVLASGIHNIFKACGVTPSPFSESLSLPAQQIVRTVISNGNITDSQMQQIESFFDIDAMQGYKPYLADPAKNSLKKEYLEEHKGEFIKLWFSLMPSNFVQYCAAFAMQTCGYWDYRASRWTVLPDINAIEDLGVQKINLLRITMPFAENPFTFLHIGTMVWISAFLVAYLIYRKQYKRLLLFLPTGGVWATLLIATPVFCEFRYILCLPMLLPFFILITFRPIGRVFNEPEYTDETARRGQVKNREHTNAVQNAL